MEENINQENLQPGGDEMYVWWKDKRIWLIFVITVLIAIVVVIAIIIFTNKGDNKKELLPGLITKEDTVQIEDQVPERNGKMSLIADKSSYSVGDEINVDIMMDTMGSNIVVASALVFYDEDELEFVGRNNLADLSESSLKMSIANYVADGVIEVVAGNPGDGNYLDDNDGFSGDDGLLATLSFKAKKTGSVSVKFGEKCRQGDGEKVCDKSNLILDDGRGTGMVMQYQDLMLNIQ